MPDPGVPTQDKVYIKKPDPSGEGIVIAKDTPVKTEEVPMPFNDAEASGILNRFESFARSLRSDEEVADNVSQHALEDTTSLLRESWLGTEQEELDA